MSMWNRTTISYKMRILPLDHKDLFNQLKEHYQLAKIQFPLVSSSIVFFYVKK